MLDSIFHIMLNVFCNRIFGVKMSSFCNIYAIGKYSCQTCSMSNFNFLTTLCS